MKNYYKYMLVAIVIMIITIIVAKNFYNSKLLPKHSEWNSTLNSNLSKHLGQANNTIKSQPTNLQVLIANPIKSSNNNDEKIDTLPFRYIGNGGQGKIVDQNDHVLIDSGEQISIAGATVGPDHIQVLVYCGNADYFVINSATSEQVQLPERPPGKNMLGFGKWHWIGDHKLLGVSAMTSKDTESQIEGLREEPNISQDKLYVYDLTLKKLSAVAIPSIESVTRFVVMEANQSGEIMLVNEKSDDAESGDLGWFKID